jgi:hypothetical protein
VVVTSDDPEAKQAIDSFRTGRKRWIVAVRMVSEGVDMPRLRVGVYATSTTTDLFFRQAVGRPRGADLAGLADAVALVAWWNKSLARPGKGAKNKIRILTAERLRAIRLCVETFGLDEVAAAIDAYSRSAWNISKNVWMSPDHFFSVSRMTTWAEAAAAQAEERQRRAELAANKHPEVRALEAQVAAEMAARAEGRNWAAAVDALPLDQREEITRRAVAELIGLGVKAQRVTPFSARMQAAVILRRETKELPIAKCRLPEPVRETGDPA